jgi:glyoxylase-like metal-dependent hydrolase (beta-lactamase superfamily II)
LFEPQKSVLISADAFWEKGFGVVFPEVEGTNGFSEAARTLEIIEKLKPSIVIPGHGRVFRYQKENMDFARQRLDSFIKDPTKHARYAAKVLIKFKLIEWQTIEIENLMDWAMSTSQLHAIHKGFFGYAVFNDWISELLAELARSKAALVERERVTNT